jgi:hypothetical protein
MELLSTKLNIDFGRPTRYPLQAAAIGGIFVYTQCSFRWSLTLCTKNSHRYAAGFPLLSLPHGAVNTTLSFFTFFQNKILCNHQTKA